MPQTYILPEDYGKCVLKLNEESSNLMIAKPSKGKGGEGIYFIASKKAVPKSYDGVDFVVQDYLTNPLLIDKKKFDLRLYLLVKGVDKMEAYIASEGMVRFCTEDYANLNPDDIKDLEKDILCSHLTNFSLNKDNNNYINNNDFLENDTGSKRLLSSLYTTLEKQGVDINQIKTQINTICSKLVFWLQPYLAHSYHNIIGTLSDTNQNWFHIFGIDIMLDDDYKWWLIEINWFPSFTYFYIKDTSDAYGWPERKKVVNELDKHLKTLI